MCPCVQVNVLLASALQFDLRESVDRHKHVCLSVSVSVSVSESVYARVHFMML